MLEIRITKPEQARPRQVRIPINGKQDNATIEGSSEAQDADQAKQDADSATARQN